MFAAIGDAAFVPPQISDPNDAPELGAEETPVLEDSGSHVNSMFNHKIPNECKAAISKEDAIDSTQQSNDVV